MFKNNGIRVDYRKWPDTTHWQFTIYPLGEDTYGRWFYLLEGASLQRGTEPSVIKTRTSTMLLGDDVWWSAFWNTDKTKAHELYIDVITPAIWKGNKVMMIDLDLDIVRTWDGKVEIIDRDEFELHQKILNYPREVIDTAERTAEALAESVASRQEPFGITGDAWRDEAISRNRL